jgi:hypothetical protein
MQTLVASVMMENILIVHLIYAKIVMRIAKLVKMAQLITFVFHVMYQII